MHILGENSIYKVWCCIKLTVATGNLRTHPLSVRGTTALFSS